MCDKKKMLGVSIKDSVANGILEDIKEMTLEFLLEWKDENGASLLHVAAENGQLAVLKELLLKGLPWNLLDNYRISAAEYALKSGFPEIYDFLVDEGCRAELLFCLMSPADKDDVSNNEYLNSKLTYSHGLLIDESGNAVMMGWEAPLMKEHVKHICAPKKSPSILNVGFGLGIIDTYIQECNPSRHVIIEAHPDVLAHMKAEGWYEKSNVEIIEGRWQDFIENVGVFDGIFFDTFGEYYQDLKGNFQLELTANSFS
jgi:protein arginine N-methyltransferase 2